VSDKICKFVNHTSKQGWKLEIFIDLKTITDEATNKWRRRREKEVRDQTRKIPQGANLIIGEIFKINGVKVHYSLEADCDDTIASYAQFYSGSILSKDKDMFRYNNSTFDVYKNFHYRKGILCFSKHRTSKRANYISKREIIFPPPKTIDTFNSGTLFTSGIYLRGSPSPLTRKLGNLHIIFRPLRQAVYHRLGLQSCITEEFPCWDDNKKKTVWVVDSVKPDDKLDYLLDTPEQVLKYFINDLCIPPHIDKNMWFNHIYASRVIIYELISIVTKCSVVELLSNDYNNIDKLKHTSITCTQCIQCHKKIFVKDAKLPKKCGKCTNVRIYVKTFNNNKIYLTIMKYI